MIDNALNVLVSELNNFFRIKYQLSEDIIILSNIVNSSGENTYKDENKLIVSLINIEEEKIIQKANGNHKNAPLYINIYILISTSFNEKLINEALKFLSSVIAFFQSKRKFTNTNTASLSSNIDKLLVDIHNLNTNDLSNVYSYLGTKYTPSIAYKVSMLIIEEEVMTYKLPEITGRETDSDIKR